MFSTFKPCVMPPILMGNNTYMAVTEKGSIIIGEGTFHDVLCVPSLSHNLLSIYQINKNGVGKTQEFITNLIIIKYL